MNTLKTNFVLFIQNYYYFSCYKYNYLKKEKKYKMKKMKEMLNRLKTEANKF